MATKRLGTCCTERWIVASRLGLTVAVALLVCAASTVRAEQRAGGGIEDEIDAALAAEPGTSEPRAEPAEAPVETDLPQIGEDRLAVFVLQRGFYVSTDLGVFMTLRGMNGYSNAQPYMSIKAGYDIGEHVSLQLSGSSGYASGNPVSDRDAPGLPGGRGIKDYELLNLGVEVVGAFRPTERIAIEPKVGIGGTRVAPEITDPTPEAPGATLGPMLGHAVVGLDIKYLTLLTDFTAGVTVCAYYMFDPTETPDSGILALAEGFVLRYTF